MSALPLDPGLQPERTELAWRRTALAIAVGSLVALRVLPAAFADPLWVVPGVFGLLFAGVIWLRSRSRYHAYLRAASVDTHEPRPDGKLLFALAALAIGIGAFGLLVAFTLIA